MLPDPNEFKNLMRALGHDMKCAWARFRILRLERKIEQRRQKEINLHMKGWAR